MPSPTSSPVHHSKPKFMAVVGLVSIMAAMTTLMAVELPDGAMAKLGDEKFQVRETAQKEILSWALEHKQQSAKLLLAQHRAAKDPEVKFRCMRILEDLARDEYATHGQGFIGIQMRDEIVMVPGKDGLQAAIRISFILPGLAAEKAGLKVGDLIVGIDGKGWDTPATDAMRQQVMGMMPTTKITLQVLRNKKLDEVVVTLVKRPVTADNPMFDRMPGRAEKAEQEEWEQFFLQWKQKHDPGA